MPMHELPAWKRNLFLFLYFVVYLAGWQLWLSEIIYHHFGTRAYFAGYLIVYLLFLVVFVLTGLSWYQKEWEQFCKGRSEYAAASLSTTVVLFAGVFVLNLIFFGVFHIDTPDNQANNLMYMHADPSGFLISSLIFAPFMEETVFRGCIFAPLRQKHSFVFSALISGSAFGLLHVLASVIAHDYSQCIYGLVYGLCGFLLAVPYEKTGSVCGGMLTHMLYNLLGIVFMLI